MSRITTLILAIAAFIFAGYFFMRKKQKQEIAPATIKETPYVYPTTLSKTKIVTDDPVTWIDWDEDGMITILDRPSLNGMIKQPDGTWIRP